MRNTTPKPPKNDILKIMRTSTKDLIGENSVVTIANTSAPKAAESAEYINKIAFDTLSSKLLSVTVEVA